MQTRLPCLQPDHPSLSYFLPPVSFTFILLGRMYILLRRMYILLGHRSHPSEMLSVEWARSRLPSVPNRCGASIEFSLTKQKRTRQALAASVGNPNRARQPTPTAIVPVADATDLSIFNHLLQPYSNAPAPTARSSAARHSAKPAKVHTIPFTVIFGFGVIMCARASTVCCDPGI